MRCSKVFMYIWLRLQQICCCCCKRRRVYIEAVDPPNEDFGSGDSTIDLEHTDGLGTLPSPNKINLDYEEDDHYARIAPKTQQQQQKQTRAQIVLQAVNRQDWLNDSLFRGEKAMTTIRTAFGPLEIEQPVALDPSTGRVTYTVYETVGPSRDAIAHWMDETHWASVALLFGNRMRVAEVTRLK